MLWILATFLPAMNWEKCDMPDIGYTCSDLQNGVDKLRVLLERPRTHRVIYFYGTGQWDIIAYLRMVTLGLALNSDSIPTFIKTKSFPSSSSPSIALFKKRQTATTRTDICINLTSLTEDVVINADPIQMHLALLNPTMANITRYLGPAGYHILVHLALNLSSGFSKTGPPLFVESDAYVKPELFDKKALKYTDKTPLKFEDILGAQDVGCALGSFRGWMMNIMRGLPSLLCEPVSGASFRPKSYIAGLLNPLYTGAVRSPFELTSVNSFCGDHAVTRELIGKLL